MRRRYMNKTASGYVTSGLIFWLDGLDVDSSSLWIDKIGNKNITLNNCVINNNENGVIFNGLNSYGIYNGLITNGVTIEAAYTLTNTTQSFGVFGQKSDRTTNPNIILARAVTTKVFYTNCKDQNSDYGYAPVLQTEIVSATYDGLKTIRNKIELPTSTGNKGPCTGDSIYIGCLRGSSNSLTWFMPGTLHSLRIYNRELTKGEMLRNQEEDKRRYGL